MMEKIEVIKTITDAHSALGLDKPKHPLISIIPAKDLNPGMLPPNLKIRVDLYLIWLKDGAECEIGYGRNSYDFREGTLAFMKAGQVLTNTGENNSEGSSGWVLMFHPDLIRKSELGNTIHNYTFFDYEVSEALHVSDDERSSLTEIANKIEQELSRNIDRHSQKLIVSNIELMLDYCTRYYDRQFYTRTNLNQDLVSKFESLLREYYEEDKQKENRIPTLNYCGVLLNMSPHYLSDLLKKETGKSGQEHIHTFVIERAKSALLSTTEQISQIAYDLGFEYPQHFSKLFKSKTGMSPAEYRSLN